MCGILGGNNPNWNYEQGIERIHHRGPDGKCIEKYNNMIFAFCRLAIQDLSQKAMQPISDTDNMVHILYNGEIYGYQELKDQLEKKYEFYTSSDTEVVLNAYLEYGEGFVDKIDGIFAVAIYDERIQKVYLYRDRIGVKPLYYYQKGTQFAFASELKALTELLGNIDLKIDKLAIYDYLFYQYVPEPKSMYENIYKLRPATKLVFDVIEKRIIREETYWNLNINASVGRKRKRKDVAEELRELISQVVNEQMIADVPVGTFLSGGVDSSIITYEANQLKEAINAFSIGFQEAQFDESKQAANFCKEKRISLVQRILQNEEIIKIRNKLSEWYDEPFGDTSAYSTYLVSKLAKTRCTVVLTGDGGDELFGGYGRYRSLAIKGSGLSMAGVYVKYVEPASTVEDFRKKWGIPEDYNPYWHYGEFYEEELPIYTRMRYLDLMTYLPGAILTKLDRVSMAVSLEARVPYLARKIVEFAFSLSQEECISGEELKGCLKDAYQGIIPEQILYGQKKGFNIPDNCLWRERHERNKFAGILKVHWSRLDQLCAI